MTTPEKKSRTSGKKAFDPGSMNNFGPTIRTTILWRLIKSE
jgi:hypothetical protein